MTVCTKDKKHLFVAEPLRFHDTSRGQEFDLSPAGEIVREVWDELPNRWPGIVQDSLVIMPNHVHAIIGFNGPIIQNGSVKTISDVIGQWKSLSWHHMKQQWNCDQEFRRSWNGKRSATPKSDSFPAIWQKSYHDRIIRNDKELELLQQYIRDNPILWEQDSLNPKNNS